MFACPLPPIPHRALIEPKSMHDGLDWTAVSQQRNHQQHRLRLCAQPIENRPFRRRKRLLALIADVPLFLLTMQADVSFFDLPSCRAINIRAKYVVGAEGGLLSWL
jgi:hypothetical protein